MKPPRRVLLFVVCAGLAAAGCAGAPGDPLAGSRPKADPGKADSSAIAVFLDFNFDGELVTSSSWNPKQQIEDQMLYTMGQLNGDNSVGRLDKLELTNVQSESIDGGKTRVTYHASLLVAWGKRNDVPATYDLVLPRDVGYSALSKFAEDYGHSCVDWGAHDVDSGSMWYYFRPRRSGCQLADEQVVRTQATVTPSTVQTTGKFPEYDMVWSDNTLRVVAVFGKTEVGATSPYDAGISAYRTFVTSVRSLLRDKGLQTEPAELPAQIGVETPDIELRGDLGGGRTVVINALLVDSVRQAGSEFYARYAALSPTADLIAYNGHSGLGSNIRALASRGRWVRGQYAIVFMNGCDSYSYVDDALAQAHARVNPDDPNGTKYLDIVTNAMPAYFHSDAPATMALVKGLLSYDAPRTYEQIFRDIDSSQVVLVSGEEDNTYTPGGGGDPDPAWGGLDASGTVARDGEDRQETPTLPAGTYVFELDGDNDADLYVRIGSAPTTSDYDCRPYLYGSRESCKVTLSEPAPVHVMVRGWAASSSYTLVGRAEP